MKHVRKKVRYAVRQGDVRLAVTIGSGQIGSIAVFRDGKEVASGASMLSLPLGPGGALLKTTIEVASFVQDILSTTNRVSVEYVLSGGVKKETFVSRTTVASHLDAARFTTAITFAEKP
jgi:hypothetical protein